MKFIFCPKCQGKGVFENKKCHTCLGRGTYNWFGGYLLYLGKPFDRISTIIFNIKRLLRVIIKAILALFGLFGIVCLIKIVVELPGIILVPEFLKQALGKLNLDQNTLSLFFWLSVLTDLYLFYFIEYAIEKQQKNWPKSTRDTAYLSNSWEEAHSSSKEFKININSSFSVQSVRIIQKAWKLAKKLKSEKIEPIHIFSAAIEIDNDTALAINRLGLNWSVLKDKVNRTLNSVITTKSRKALVYSLEAKKVILYSYNLAGIKKRLALSPLEILESLVSFEGPVKEIFYDLEIKKEHVKNVCLWIDVYSQLVEEHRRFKTKAKFKPKGPINRSYTAMATPYLDAYSQDLTQLARAGYLDVCMNREREIKGMFRIFESGQQGIILIGHPGVGKTSIINGLARRMVTENVPKSLQDKRLVSLKLSSLIAGASRPGEIEERIQIIISEISRSGNIILFIKDIHNMIGIKTTEGELDVSEILASALKSNLLSVIATSITSEYRRLIEGQSLDNIFERINIDEPDKNTTIQILEAHTVYIENKERVYFSYGALDKAVDLSMRYLHEKFLPEKAINLLRQVAVSVKNKRGEKSIVQAEDVAELISEKTKIPVTKITAKESEKLLNLEEQIHRRLIGQDEAVNMVSSALRRARTELRSAKRPIVNLLFLGPTGVGKTELAKTVAEVYFGSEENIIRLDMSEYQEKSSINRLIGSPMSERGGYLTDSVRRSPSSILLLDEIEKAHPDILNIFLQVMDDGRLTDSLGRTIDFTNIILISTSNAGTEFIQDEIKKGTPLSEIQEVLIQEKLKPYFRPEFLNRFDGVVVFKPLSISEIVQITRLMLKKLEKQLENKGIVLKVTDEAVEELANAGFDPVFGARPLRRVIQNKVNDVLAEYLLTGKVGRRDVVILESGGKIRIEKAKQI